jgi:hypothetical protein
LSATPRKAGSLQPAPSQSAELIFGFLLFRLAGRNRFCPFDRAKSFSYRRVLRDEPHALAESFAFSGCLAGVPISGMNRGAVAAQTNFSRRLRHVPPAFWIPRGPLFALRLGLAHRTPPVTGSWREPSLQPKNDLTHPCLLCEDYLLFSSRVSIAAASRKLGPGPTQDSRRFRGVQEVPRSTCPVQSDGSRETAGCGSGERVSARGLVT